jgi:anti-anti-sigma regulatory factor
MRKPADQPSLVARQRGEPAVITLNEPLTRRAVQRLQSVVRGVSPERTVILDLATVPGFDSQGVVELQALQEDVGTNRLVVVGLRQAAARLFGLAVGFANGNQELLSGAAAASRPTPGMVLVEVKPASSGHALHSTLQSAIAKDIAIVIVDLRSVAVSMEALGAIAAASRASALHGQELVLVNVAPELMRLLGRMDLAATTHVAVTH